MCIRDRWQPSRFTGIEFSGSYGGGFTSLEVIPQFVYTVSAVSYTHLDVYKRQGYSTPRVVETPGILDPSQLKLKYNISGQNKINPSRISGYGQFSRKFYWGENRVFINAGVRAQHWDCLLYTSRCV